MRDGPDPRLLKLALGRFVGLMVGSTDISLLQLQETAFPPDSQPLSGIQGQQCLLSTVIPVRDMLDPAVEPIEDALGVGSCRCGLRVLGVMIASPLE